MLSWPSEAPSKKSVGGPLLGGGEKKMFPYIPFWLQKGTKKSNLLMQFWWCESSRRELSKSGLRMFLRPLVMILSLFEGLGKWPKIEGGLKKIITVLKSMTWKSRTKVSNSRFFFKKIFSIENNFWTIGDMKKW